MNGRGGELDVIVVGAGPAGSAVAARLARAGHRVLLVDRAEFPRRKPCGDCVSPAAVRALAALGALERVRAGEHSELSGWSISPVSGPPFRGRFPAGQRGIGVARERLDGILLDLAREAGVAVRLGFTVTDLRRDGGAVTGVVGRDASGDHVLEARLVIGADGLRSVVSRRLGLLRRPPRLRKLALTARLAGLRAPDGHGELRARAWGCLGVAPIGDGLANVTVVVNDARAEGIAGRPADYFDAVVAATPDLAQGTRRGKVLATGPFDFPTRSAVHDGALLVGDAAGYYDPFTGQGIYRALRAAELAAERSDQALRAGDVTARFLRAYDETRRSEISASLRLQHAIEAFVSRPRLLEAAASVLRRRPGLADTLIAVTGDLRPVRDLARPGALRAAR